MKFFKIFLLATLLIGWMPSKAIAQSDSVPGFFYGTWEGTGKQHNSGEWPIWISITGGKTGEAIGRVQYPSLGCSGSLYLLEANDNQLVLTEKIESGWRCVTTGTLWLTFAGEWIDYYWDNEKLHSFRANGMLLPVRNGEEE